MQTAINLTKRAFKTSSYVLAYQKVVVILVIAIAAGHWLLTVFCMVSCRGEKAALDRTIRAFILVYHTLLIG